MEFLKLRPFLFPGIALLFATGCQPEIRDYQEQLFVYATLMPGQRYQSIIVDRTRAIDEPTPDSLVFGISGAQVTLRCLETGESIAFRESDTIGLYHDYDAITRPSVKPCSTYHLQVRYGPFQGEQYIRIPGEFAITSPAFMASFSDTNLPVCSWRRSAGTAGYRLYAVDTLRRRRSFLRRLPVATTDTMIDIRPFYQGLFDSTGTYVIRVFALDSHLLRLERGAVDTIGPRVLAVIGSQTVATTIVNYTRVRR